MKNRVYIAFVLLALYTSVLGKVFVPWLSFQFNLDYASNEFCLYNDILMEKCDGSCFLNHSVEKHNHAEKQAEKHGNVAKADIPAFILQEAHIDVVSEAPELTDFFYTLQIFTTYLPVPTEPPQQLA